MANIGGLPIRNTNNLITPDTRMCALCFAPSGFGKTTLAATLDKMTKEFMGKPSLIIAVEAGEGGGTMSLEGKGIEFVCPQDFNDIEKLLAALATDTTYGGIAFDSATEYVKRFLQPYAMSFPSREHMETRKAGVPERSDYQTMGEKSRQQFNRLINLTTHPDLKVRKHLLVTALERDKENDQGVTVSIRPDLPGAMAGTATAMFQTVMSLAIKVTVEKDEAGKPKRVSNRVLLTAGDGVRQIKDRTNLFPHGCEPDLAEVYRKYWLPKFAEVPNAA